MPSSLISLSVSIETPDVRGVDQYRSFRAINEMIRVEITPLYEKEVVHNFGDRHQRSEPTDALSISTESAKRQESP